MKIYSPLPKNMTLQQKDDNHTVLYMLDIQCFESKLGFNPSK